eukprot:TRINITY_DN6981_c0_g1_i1.p1 TRINITY_DN6981_c0_g1~~TRINITY_DN6981_c0_g1_i1.p1  ORF type:complete len:218 (-),score=68.62 TRINITY_DN6981_c0_g1_i1:533-1093(-)
MKCAGIVVGDGSGDGVDSICYSARDAKIDSTSISVGQGKVDSGDSNGNAEMSMESGMFVGGWDGVSFTDGTDISSREEISLNLFSDSEIEFGEISECRYSFGEVEEEECFVDFFFSVQNNLSEFKQFLFDEIDWRRHRQLELELNFIEFTEKRISNWICLKKFTRLLSPLCIKNSRNFSLLEVFRP